MRSVAGTVFLGGGGSPADERNVWYEAYWQVESVLYWPFALTGPILGTADHWFHAALTSLDIAAAHVSTWMSLEGHSGTELGNFDLLHIGGGNTFRLLHEIRRHSFVDSVRDFVRSGGTYYGGSAGAVIACEDISIAVTHDPNDVGLVDLTGLALVPAYAVLPHYDDRLAGWSLAWAQEQHTALLALPERGGIRYQDNTFTVIGPHSTVEIDQSGPTVRPVGTSWPHHAR